MGSNGKGLPKEPFSWIGFAVRRLELPDEHERDDQRVDDEDSISARPTIIGMRSCSGGRVARDPSSPAAMALPWPIAPPNAAIAMPNPAPER